MKFPPLDRFRTGVAVPVSALRSKNSFGTGEFPDLLPLGTWCSRCGIDLIQILPINDTGFQSSPYSALSAFALHPLFVRIQDLPEITGHPENPEVKKVLEILKKQRKQFDELPRIHYFDVLLIKLSLLKQLYLAFRDDLLADKVFRAWIKKNPWIRTYAVFCYLKDKFGLAGWKSWPEMRRPTSEDLRRYWETPGLRRETLFYAWVQWRIEAQLVKAAQGLEEMGVYLKGDLPILMSEDSADVWANPHLFDTSMRAGAPPDMFSSLGQNWGFPVYAWNALEEQDYDWWKDRLRQADKFYHAFRIDHVLGFFRIWRVPANETSGILGHFSPAVRLSREELLSAGFDEGRLAWMSRPHVPGQEIRAAFGDRAQELVQEVFHRLGDEDLFIFKEEENEGRLQGLDYPEEAKQALLSWYRNRTLLEAVPGWFSPAWYYGYSRAWGSLSDQERWRLQGLFDRVGRESEELWEREGEKLLEFMKDTTSMLACAEDLGVIPECVPRVLERLGILGLRIPRWARRYKSPGEPYILPREYPFLSVCAPSVHDTSTLRQWWEEEAERQAVWEALGMSCAVPHAYTTEAAQALFAAFLDASSSLVVFQLQDYLALNEGLRQEDPVDERVNVPGTVDSRNWTYRMPVTLENLLKDTALCRRIRDLAEVRRRREPGGMV